jgi:Cu2+-exporting ATPase
MMQVVSFAVAMYAGVFQGMDQDIRNFLRLVSLLVATPVVFYAGSPFFQGAWHDLRRRRPGMDVPVAIAIAGAWVASVWNTFVGTGEVYFDSATMFVFFLTGARYLELQGRNKALAITDTLSRHIPRIARRLTAEGSELVGVVELDARDRVLVPSGETIPADGFLESGARVSEALLSGESVPVRKEAGDRVIAGSVNAGQPLTMVITEIGADTVMAEIDRLVSGARLDRPGVVRASDRVATWFVSAVIILAGAVALSWWQLDPSRAFEITLATLVVSCPCALALATPAAFTVAMSRLARNGFLVRRSGALEQLARISHCYFDKTGTLTDASPTVCRVATFADLDEDSALEIAARLEATSSHPLARAFTGRTTEQAAANVQVTSGAGLEGEIDGDRYRIGSAGFTGAVPHDSTMKSVFLSREGTLLARFDIAERIRAGAGQVIASLNREGIATSILSGDQPGPVSAVARELNITNWSAELTPRDKLGVLQQVQNEGGIPAMVGDGVNDSPVLAGASVSVAMGDGTPMAQQSADCVIVDSPLTLLLEAIRVARFTVRVVRQNLGWALGYNLLAIPLAATGQIAPWMAALGMSASSLIVTFNALRLRAGGPVLTPDPLPDAQSESPLHPGTV